MKSIGYLLRGQIRVPKVLLNILQCFLHTDAGTPLLCLLIGIGYEVDPLHTPVEELLPRLHRLQLHAQHLLNSNLELKMNAERIQFGGELLHCMCEGGICALPKQIQEGIHILGAVSFLTQNGLYRVLDGRLDLRTADGELGGAHARQDQFTQAQDETLVRAGEGL